MAKTLYLIDGHAQIFRAYYAPFGNLTSPSGEPTRATHVFFQMILNLIRDRRPDYLAVALDVADETTFRRSLYPEYKAHRDPAPEDLGPQIRRIISILQAARIPMLRKPGFEADDLMATLAARFGEDGAMHVFLVSKDKDLDQVLGPNVSLYDPGKDEVVTAARLPELKGWRPDQAVEVQTLCGDSVDNVPGVAGIGPKTAAKLIARYGTARAVIENAGALTPRQRENVLAFAPHLELTRQLVTLRRDVPLDFDLPSCAVEGFDWDAAKPVFEELGFRRLTDQVAARAARSEPRERPASGGDPPAPARPAAARPAAVSNPPPTAAERLPASPGRPRTRAPATDGTPGLFDAIADPPADFERASPGEDEADGVSDEPAPMIRDELAQALSRPVRGLYRLVNTREALASLRDALGAQREFAIDTETTDVNPVDADLVGLSVAWRPGEAYYVPVRAAAGEVLPLDDVRRELGGFLCDPGRRKVGQNIKYDMIVLAAAGMPIVGPLFDTMVASFVIDSTRRSHGLDWLAAAYFGHRMIPLTDLIGKGADQIRIDQAPLPHVCEYSCEDVDYTWRLKEVLEPQLARRGVDGLFHQLEMPLVAVLAQMESHGVRVDAQLLARLGQRMAARAAEIAERVQSLAGRRFNLDSTRQLSEVLFDHLKLRVVKRTRTTRSTDAETLEVLARETGHEIPALLLEYRELQKLRGTYVEALPRAASRRTGRIHTSYHQTGAVTGRLSSSEPNLQNIPIRTDLGREIRRAFVPRTPDEVLISADYSQIELRVLAHFCGDENLTRAFIEDMDIHAFVASQVNNVPLAQVSKEMRAQAKAVNFGIIYGQTAFGLARGTGMSQSAAQAFIDAYFRRYPRIRCFIDECVAGARRSGFVTTILGRRREISGLDSRNRGVRAQGERLAVNTVIQGSAADLIKTAMVRLHERIVAERLPLRMLLQVHDELVCEGPRAAAESLAETIRGVMSTALPLRVPIRVDAGWGDNWVDAK